MCVCFCLGIHFSPTNRITFRNNSNSSNSMSGPPGSEWSYFSVIPQTPSCFLLPSNEEDQGGGVWRRDRTQRLQHQQKALLFATTTTTFSILLAWRLIHGNHRLFHFLFSIRATHLLFLSFCTLNNKNQSSGAWQNAVEYSSGTKRN